MSQKIENEAATQKKLYQDIDSRISSMRVQNDELQVRVDSLSNNINQIQNNIKMISTQVNDIRLLITEEQINDRTDGITKEIQTIKQQTDQLINNQNASKQN